MSAPLSSIQRSGSVDVPVSPSANREEQFLRIAKIVLPIIAAVAVLLTFPPVLSIPLTIAIAAGAIYFHRKSSESPKTPPPSQENREPSPSPRHDKQVAQEQSEASEEPPPYVDGDRSSQRSALRRKVPKHPASALRRKVPKHPPPAAVPAVLHSLPMLHRDVKTLLKFAFFEGDSVHISCSEKTASLLIDYLNKTGFLSDVATYEKKQDPMDARFFWVDLTSKPKEKMTPTQIYSHLITKIEECVGAEATVIYHAMQKFNL